MSVTPFIGNLCFHVEAAAKAASNEDASDEDCGLDAQADGISEACVSKIQLEPQLELLAIQLATAQADPAAAQLNL